MGKVLSSIKHPFRNFNVEDRAHKIISRSKPIPAPKFPKEQMDLDRILKEHPEILEESLKKNQELDKNLRDVYVTSTDKNPEIPTNPDRPLPLERGQAPSFLFGIKEPEKIPLGKISLRNALKFLTDHTADPKAYPVEKISAEHSLPQETIHSIIKYFKVFQVYMPKEKKVKASFVGPATTTKVTIEKIPRAALPEGKPKKDET